MQFELTEDQHYLSDQIQLFAQQELSSIPASTEPMVVHQRLGLLAEQGMLGLCIPENKGGAGIDPVTLCRCLSLLGEIDASIATAAAIINGFVIPTLIHCATPAQQQEHLEKIQTGENIIAWCDGRSEHRPSIQAKKEQNQWLLNGTVPFAPLAAIATHLLVKAEDEGGCYRFFLLPKETGTQVKINPLAKPLGLRHAGTASLSLSDAPVSEKEHIGRLSTWTNTMASNKAQLIEQAGQTALASVSVGIARAALTTSCAYAKERRQFGKPLAGFQAIQWKIADMAMNLEAASLLTSRAASAWQETPEQSWQEWSFAARTKSSEIAAKAAQEAIQIHGGYGFTTEFSVERLYRDAHTLRACWNPTTATQNLLASSVIHHY